MRKLMMLVAVLAATATGSAFAADATLQFNGTFWQPSCEVDSSTVNQTVNLAKAQVSDFAAVGSTANPTAFNLKLSNCGAGTNVTMTVSGTTDTVSSVLKNTGTATQVGVQLLQATRMGATTGNPVTLERAVTLGVVDGTNSMTIPLVAQYYRLGSMTAGTVSATATVNFTYD